MEKNGDDSRGTVIANSTVFGCGEHRGLPADVQYRHLRLNQPERRTARGQHAPVGGSAPIRLPATDLRPWEAVPAYFALARNFPFALAPRERLQ
jgi:hypothetical protein